MGTYGKYLIKAIEGLYILEIKKNSADVLKFWLQ